MAVWEQGGQPTASYEWFTELVHCVFDHSPEENEVGEMLLFITQGSCQVAKYVFEFCTIVVGGGWNNSALKAIFCQGLNPNSVHQDVMPYQAFNPWLPDRPHYMAGSSAAWTAPPPEEGGPIWADLPTGPM